MNKTEENNYLIADFMNWNINSVTTMPDNLHLSNLELDNGGVIELLFNTSWDWLMPVIVKICDNNHWSIKDLEKSLSLNYGLDNFLILDDTYMAVVKYIEDEKGIK